MTEGYNNMLHNFTTGLLPSFFFKTGVTFAVSQSPGTVPVDIDWVKMTWSIGVISTAQCLSTIDGISFGPGDLLVSSLQSS